MERGTLQGKAEEQKGASQSERIPLGLNESIAASDHAELMCLYDRVSDQVVDTVVEMSRYTADRVAGVDAGPSPDIHFTNVDREGVLLPREEVAQNCKDAGMDPTNTVLGPGSVSPNNIVLNKDGNFVGFSHLYWAGYASREWVQLGLIHPNDIIAAGVWRFTSVHYDVLTTEPRQRRVLLWWRDILSEKLVSKGFPNLDAHRLHWLKRKHDHILGHEINGSE